MIDRSSGCGITMRMKTMIGIIVIMIIVAIISGVYSKSSNEMTTIDLQLGRLYWAEDEKDREATIRIEIYEPHAPEASSRFKILCKSGYYNGNRFYRVSPDYLAQFGVNDDPKLTAKWDSMRLEDKDTSRTVTNVNKNKQWTIGFAREFETTSGSQVYINLKDNRELFANMTLYTFGTIVSGQEKLKGLFPAEPGIQMGKYDKVNMKRVLDEGGAYLDKFSKLSIINKCTIVHEARENKEEL